jgi:hypothetical protein
VGEDVAYAAREEPSRARAHAKGCRGGPYGSDPGGASQIDSNVMTSASVS